MCTLCYLFRWIEAMERLPGLLVPGLVYLVNKAENKGSITFNNHWFIE